jgi:hypothetical protein
MRGFYSNDWPEISQTVRFERGRGVCQSCGRPHRVKVRCLPDGRWFDAEQRIWRTGRGRAARWPDLIDIARIRHTRVVLAAAHLDHDPRNNRLRNLKSLCQRCHLIHDRPHHRAQRRLTYLLRRALGDLFLGPYPLDFIGQTPQIAACLRSRPRSSTLPEAFSIKGLISPKPGSTAAISSAHPTRALPEPLTKVHGGASGDPATALRAGERLPLKALFGSI